jgi:hypothetical protein
MVFNISRKKKDDTLYITYSKFNRKANKTFIKKITDMSGTLINTDNVATFFNSKNSHFLSQTVPPAPLKMHITIC